MSNENLFAFFVAVAIIILTFLCIGLANSLTKNSTRLMMLEVNISKLQHIQLALVDTVNQLTDSTAALELKSRDEIELTGQAYTIANDAITKAKKGE